MAATYIIIKDGHYVYIGSCSTTTCEDLDQSNFVLANIFHDVLKFSPSLIPFCTKVKYSMSYRNNNKII